MTRTTQFLPGLVDPGEEPPDISAFVPKQHTYVAKWWAKPILRLLRKPTSKRF